MYQFGNHAAEPRDVNGGHQWKFKFDNGFGASVVCHRFSYGGDRGLYEIAVLGHDGHITYDTPITNDVLGYLDTEEVAATLDKIQALTPGGQVAR